MLTLKYQNIVNFFLKTENNISTISKWINNGISPACQTDIELAVCDQRVFRVETPSGSGDAFLQSAMDQHIGSGSLVVV